MGEQINAWRLAPHEAISFGRLVDQVGKFRPRLVQVPRRAILDEVWLCDAGHGTNSGRHCHQHHAEDESAYRVGVLDQRVECPPPCRGCPPRPDARELALHTHAAERAHGGHLVGVAVDLDGDRNDRRNKHPYGEVSQQRVPLWRWGESDSVAVFFAVSIAVGRAFGRTDINGRWWRHGRIIFGRGERRGRGRTSCRREKARLGDRGRCGDRRRLGTALRSDRYLSRRLFWQVDRGGDGQQSLLAGPRLIDKRSDLRQLGAQLVDRGRFRLGSRANCCSRPSLRCRGDYR